MRIPFLDDLLNKYTMYKITLYYLIALVGIAILLSAAGILPYSPWDIAIETAAALLVCYISNKVFAWIFSAVTNTESVLITALILVLIVPVKFPHNLPFFILVSGFAMASKYFVTIEKRHLFNPAAAGIAAVSLLSPEHVATWWVGTSVMMPFVLIGGLMLMRKIEREGLISMFALVYLLVVGIASLVHNGSAAAVLTTWQQSIFSSSFLFLMFVMLTEPLTSPSTNKMRAWYAGITAVLYATPQIRVFSLALTPELALCVGNIFSYIVNPKYRFVLQLKEKILAGKDTYLFNFGKVSQFVFAPGQYMEWTLPHHNVDNRGNRRYFSLASSSGEDIEITVRFYNPPSSFKKTLLSMNQGDKIVAASLSGSFVLPQNSEHPIVFLAGGVGIAPFRSMVHAAIKENKKLSATLFYANRTVEEIAFKDEFAQAEHIGLKTIYTITGDSTTEFWTGEKGYITPDMIHKYVANPQDALFYISGPQKMVQSCEMMLEKMGIHRNSIKTDYFPGYNE